MSDLGRGKINITLASIEAAISTARRELVTLREQLLEPNEPRDVLAEDIVWPTGHRPNWWHDTEVRDAIVSMHRRSTLAEAVARLESQFGARAPGKSALDRIWLKIDKIKRRRA